MTRSDAVSALHHVFHDLPFPVQRWQLIAEAELYGIDTVTRDHLHELPLRLYSDCADVTGELRNLITRRVQQRLRHRAGHDGSRRGGRAPRAAARPAHAHASTT